jgi:hypothetical protein
MANKTCRRTRTECSTFGTDLGSIVRLDLDNFNAFSFGFVLDETLQLEETPITNPIVHNLSSPLFSDTFEVFHKYLVSIEFGNNAFADVMINPSHPTSFLSRDFAEQSLTGFCAFGLKNGTQVFEFSFDLLDFGRIIKPAIRTDSKIVYSEVDAKNSTLDIRAIGSNLFRECEQEEASTFFINSEKALSDIPTEIFFVTFRDSEWDFNSAFDCSKTKNIVFEGCRTREIISHRTSVDDWFGLGFLDHSTGLFDTSDSKLALQSITFERGIYKWMEFDVIPYLVVPCSINTKLQSFSIDFESFYYLISCSNLNFSCCPDVHNGCKEQPIFKTFGGNARNDGTQFLPTLKGLGILATII